jgi:hypothetical protein
MDSINSAQSLAQQTYNPYQNLQDPTMQGGFYQPYNPPPPPPNPTLSLDDLFIYQKGEIPPAAEGIFSSQSFSPTLSSQSSFPSPQIVAPPSLYSYIADPSDPATMIGYVSTTIDALLIFESCLTGPLVSKLVKSRLNDKERDNIRSGSIFVFLEDNGPNKRQKKVKDGEDPIVRAEFQGGIKRWTGNSRIF